MFMILMGEEIFADRASLHALQTAAVGWHVRAFHRKYLIERRRFSRKQGRGGDVKNTFSPVTAIPPVGSVRPRGWKVE